MAIRFVVTGVPDQVQRFADIEGRLVDLTPVMGNQIQMIMLRSVQQNFVAQGRPDPWPELSAATIKRRRNKDKSSIQILRDTGALMQSLSPGPGSAGNEYSLADADAVSAHIGTNRPGAIAHQEGIGVPQRKFLVFQPEDIEDMIQNIKDFIVHGGGAV